MDPPPPATKFPRADLRTAKFAREDSRRVKFPRERRTFRAAVYAQERFSSKKFASGRISLRRRPRETTFPARTFSRNDLISTLTFLFSIFFSFSSIRLGARPRGATAPKRICLPCSFISKIRIPSFSTPVSNLVSFF